MLTWRYSKQFPEGKLFDTEGREAPVPPSELNGWFDTPAKLHITQEQLIEALVNKELSKQSSDREEIETAVKRKTGKRTHFAAKDETLIKIVDGK